MQLTGELKEKVEKTESKEEAKGLIAEAGMELTDEEIDQVSGGCDNDMIVHYTGKAAAEDGVTAQFCKIASAGKVVSHFNSF